MAAGAEMQLAHQGEALEGLVRRQRRRQRQAFAAELRMDCAHVGQGVDA